VNTFEFYRLRWHFEASGRVSFPAGESANLVRGAFGILLRQTASRQVYERLFEPGRGIAACPSGLRDWPRPFVFRTAAVDGREIGAGGAFSIDMHVFDCRPELTAAIRHALEQLRETGIGPGRGRATLTRVQQLAIDGTAFELAADAGEPSLISLEPEPREESVRRVRVRFLTPTELKGGDPAAPEPGFGVLFARLRDRVSTLRALYGPGPLEIDFRGLAARARTVELAWSDLVRVDAKRRSSRTGRTHPLGGFRGDVEYTGEVGEFLPWLRAARWTGVGRQTVWGKGDLRVVDP